MPAAGVVHLSGPRTWSGSYRPKSAAALRPPRLRTPGVNRTGARSRPRRLGGPNVWSRACRDGIPAGRHRSKRESLFLLALTLSGALPPRTRPLSCTVRPSGMGTNLADGFGPTLRRCASGPCPDPRRTAHLRSVVVSRPDQVQGAGRQPIAAHIMCMANSTIATKTPDPRVHAHPQVMAIPSDLGFTKTAPIPTAVEDGHNLQLRNGKDLQRQHQPASPNGQLRLRGLCRHADVRRDTALDSW